MVAMNLMTVLGSLCALGLLALPGALGVQDPEDFVNLLAGSFTDGRSYSTGNTLPLIGRPWGFNHWAPQTTPQNSRSSSWWFSGNHHTLNWMRCTHQPSPWIGDWGWFLFMPILGSFTDNPNYFWEPRGAVIKPHIFDATLAPSGIRLELVPTMHAATLRVTFPDNSHNQEKRVCFREGAWSAHGSYLTGVASQVNKDGMLFDNFGLHIYAMSVGAATTEMKSRTACFKFKNSATSAEIRIATSLISQDQAQSNLNQEMTVKVPFEELKDETRAVWNKFLRRVDVIDPGQGKVNGGQQLELNKITTITGDSSEHLTIFYTGLYRALTFPRRIDEICHKTGKMVHFSPYDPKGGVHPGPLVTDNGFWDTFRTVYPLLGLAYRDELGTIINGWLMAYKEGKWLPSWASPGYRKCMVGTFADVVVSDAIVKGIKGFDYELARMALKKDAFEPPPRSAGSAQGKDGLNDYILKGYVPSDRGNNEGVSRTLDFGFADYATANAFDHLLKDSRYQAAHSNSHLELTEDIKKLRSRYVRGVKSQFSSHHGLMVPMSSTHNVNPGFDPLDWGRGFVEGNSWHHSFPPYALRELQELYGGKDKLLAKLRSFLSVTSDFRVGSYGQEIHEMTEMRTLAMGQYGHNNQPCHHILYLFAMLGEKRLTEKYIREVLERGYGEDFYAGDEDNGEQGAWYVLSALGLFSAVPGTPDYVMNTPLFQHTAITRGDENEPAFHIIAMGAGEDRQHSRQVYLNSKTHEGPFLSDYDIAPGGILQFVLETPEGVSDKVKIFERTDLTPLVQIDTPIPVAVETGVDYHDEVEKQRGEITRLRQQLQEMSVAIPDSHAANSQSHLHHIAQEPVLPYHHFSEVTDTPDTAHADGCWHSSTIQTGLIVLCVNVVIVCIMLAIQLQKYRRGSVDESETDVAGQAKENMCEKVCSCISVFPVLLKEGLVSVVGIQTFQSVVRTSNKEKTYTV